MDHLFRIWGSVSLGLLLLSALGCGIYHRRTARSHHTLSVWHILMLCVFAVIVAHYLPVFYVKLQSEGVGGVTLYHRTFWMTLYHSIRNFLMDWEYGTVMEVLRGIKDPWLRQLYTAYTGALMVAAPIFSASFLLSLFRGFTAGLRFALHPFRPMFIMSKMNSMSVAMAKSIGKYYEKGKGHRPVIVFADVFEEDSEDGCELLSEARDMGAICMKKDIAHLNLRAKRGPVNCFIISEDETENISHAEQLTDNYKDCENVNLYVYAASPGSGVVIDSLKKGDLVINHELEEKANREYLTEGREPENFKSPVQEGFSIRRIVPTRNLAVKTFEESKIFDLCARMNEGTISVLILGLGGTGMEFLKTALWFCQLDGYRLEINVVDKDPAEQLRRRVARECPEIISTNGKEVVGEAHYDLRFFSIDCLQEPFLEGYLRECGADLLEEEKAEQIARLARTQLALVALGDDDRNIETALMLRRVFDRMKDLSAPNESIYRDLPVIKTVVYDDKKTENVNNFDDELVNHKEQPYHVQIIGSLSQQYSYEGIKALEKTEESAFRYHMNWVSIETKLRREVMLLKKDLRSEPILMEIYVRVVEAEIKDQTLILRDAAGNELQKNDYLERLDQLVDAVSSLDTEGKYLHFKDLAARGEMALSEKLGYLEAVNGKAVEARRAKLEAAKENAKKYHLPWTKKYKECKQAIERAEREYGYEQNPYTKRYVRMLKEYEIFEYFRVSSMSKAVHKEQMGRLGVCTRRENTGNYTNTGRKTLKARMNDTERPLVKATPFFYLPRCTEGRLLCDCEHCIRRKKTEHRRWNAYMRTMGYIYNKNRNDRAKTHYDLIPWQELSVLERIKDD